MITIERLIQKIYPGKWEALEELDQKYNAVEGKFGFPPKKRYQSIMGEYDQNTLIIERQWESMAVMEATYEKILADPEYQALSKEGLGIIKSSRMEAYTPMP